MKHKKSMLLRTNLLVCLVILVGFAVTAALSYRTNYGASIQHIEQVSDLTSEDIYHQLSTAFTKPVHVSLTMAGDRLLQDFLTREPDHLQDPAFTETLRRYLDAYRQKYSYDSVFLVSTATGRYYNFEGLDRVLAPGDPENDWYYQLLASGDDYAMNVDNDEAAQNEITVFVNCKISDGQGQVLGIVGVGVRIEGLQALLRSYQETFGVSAYLIDDSSDIQLSTAYTGYQKQSFFALCPYSAGVRRQLLGWREEGEALSLWSDTKTGRDYLVARYLPELSWHLVVQRNTGPLMQGLQRQVGQTAAIIAVIIGFILLVITLVIRSYNRRIVELLQKNEQERRSVFQKATEQLFENIYELDITGDRPANQATADYFDSLGAPAGTPFSQALRIVAQKQIKEEFRQGYIDTFSPQNVLDCYRAGRDTLQYEFMISTGGDYYWMRITARLIENPGDGAVHMLTYRQNIDAEKRRQRRMQRLAHTDEMTGLYTKTATQLEMQQRLARSADGPFGFFILDIDNFKNANDSLGHEFGDTVIQSFAHKLVEHFGPEAVVGRIGGDEFAALVPNCDYQRAAQLAGELVQALSYQHRTASGSWQVSASVGVSLAPADGSDFLRLYRRADAALYKVKKQGKCGFALTGEPPA
ncbi:GGDEF domain-containing protein [Neobittarella massiliensis]|uniref:GGDEF domain-containing protein n=1 Tax=Neobittarella massiliensis (ex Bilen et al. 2018) TaxID=2041842 RepID=A0A8J6INE9_9FIRM|nr:sensor domain-containing diguanylate cyclase [Neobittarella massiliensis]MBC3515905.1 GGDEF domain-containing protein [Neobittarella massiliensis]